MYVPVIDDEPYGRQQVNVRSQQENALSLWHSIRHMIRVRREHSAFGRGDFQWVDCGKDAIAAYTRSYENQVIYVFNNLSAGEQFITIPISERTRPFSDLLTGKEYFINERTLTLKFGPGQYYWLV
jgi:maltose alpha-D-glucosyltransferase/alpha-amylase